MKTVYADQIYTTSGLETQILLSQTGEVITHKFEIAGLGKAPFSFIGVIERTTEHGQPSGTCAYCSNGIKYCCVIKDVNGKTFEVGNECVKKTHDAGMVKIITDRLKIEKKRKKDEARRAAVAAKYEAERPAREAREAAIAAQIATITTEQQWLIDILASQPGDFCQSVAGDLKTRRFADLSPRVRAIVTEIYGKQFGRYNSKAYWTGVEEFEKKVGDIRE